MDQFGIMRQMMLCDECRAEQDLVNLRCSEEGQPNREVICHHLCKKPAKKKASPKTPIRIANPCVSKKSIPREAHTPNRNQRMHNLGSAKPKAGTSGAEKKLTRTVMSEDESDKIFMNIGGLGGAGFKVRRNL